MTYQTDLCWTALYFVVSNMYHMSNALKLIVANESLKSGHFLYSLGTTMSRAHTV